MHSFAHPGFSGQPHGWQLLLGPGQAGLGAEPTAGLGNKSRLLGELCDPLCLPFPFCGLSMFTSKVCWVCTNDSQQHACESSSVSAILAEEFLADHEKMPFFFPEACRGWVKSEWPVNKGSGWEVLIIPQLLWPHGSPPEARIQCPVRLKCPAGGLNLSLKYTLANLAQGLVNLAKNATSTPCKICP